MILLASTMLLLSLRAQNSAEDSASILKRNDEAQQRNGERANRYTYVEDVDYFKYDKNGQAKKDHSETSDVIFVEGETYKRLIARNGKPLDPREAAKEEKKMKQTAEERRKERQKERRSGLFHRAVWFTSDDVKLCDHRLLGEEEIRGRKAWLVEFTPRPGVVPANQHEKDARTFDTKVWIDQVEGVTLKMIMLVARDGSALKSGSSFTFEWAKVNGDAWLMASIILDTRTERMENRYSNFRKFDVESTITVDDSPKH